MLATSRLWLCRCLFFLCCAWRQLFKWRPDSYEGELEDRLHRVVMTRVVFDQRCRKQACLTDASFFPPWWQIVTVVNLFVHSTADEGVQVCCMGVCMLNTPSVKAGMFGGNRTYFICYVACIDLDFYYHLLIQTKCFFCFVLFFGTHNWDNVNSTCRYFLLCILSNCKKWNHAQSSVTSIRNKSHIILKHKVC